MKEEEQKSNRRKFIKFGLLASGTIAAGSIVLEKTLSKGDKVASNANTVVCTTDGKVYRADSSQLKEIHLPPVSNTESRKGMAGKKFVMVINEAKCDGCKKCTEACQAMHHTESDREWIKVFKMKRFGKYFILLFPKALFPLRQPALHKSLSG